MKRILKGITDLVQTNIVVAVAYKKILILFVQLLLKNRKCFLVGVHDKLSLLNPQHTEFYKRI